MTSLCMDVVIVMHSEVDYILPTLEVMKEKWDGPLGAYAHSGYWSRPDWNFDAVISPDDYLGRRRVGWKPGPGSSAGAAE